MTITNKLLATAAVLGSLALVGTQALAGADKPAGQPESAAPGWQGPMMGGYPGMMGAPARGGGSMMGPGMMFGGGWLPDAKALEKAKAEIGIKPDQESVWKAYADAIQASFDTATGIHQSMDPQAMHQMSPEDRTAFMQGVWQSRKESLDAVAKARQDLFASLSDVQKAAAEKTLGTTAPGYGGYGMMAMMMNMMMGGGGMMGYPAPAAPTK
jgi:uncharacterized membrane protein